MNSGRHYVTIDSGHRFRRFKVVRTDVTPSKRRGGRLTLTYVTVSRHFSLRRAHAACSRFNAQEGFTA